MATMSLGDHIEDLRRHLIKALLGLIAGIAITLMPPLNLGKLVVQTLQEPARRSLARYHVERAVARATAGGSAGSFIPAPARIPARAFAAAVRQVFPSLPAPASESIEGRYIVLPQELRDLDLIAAVVPHVVQNDSLVALGPLEPAAIFFKVCLVTGLVLSSPWAFYQLWAFIAAGLYRRERMAVYRFLPYSIGLFLAGVLICFFVVLPLTLHFLLEFNAWLGVTPMLRLSDWMGFATVLPVVSGMLPTAALHGFPGDHRALHGGRLSPAKRRLAILVIVIAAVVLTPGPDASSMLFLSIPMVLLYELGILLVANRGTGEMS